MDASTIPSILRRGLAVGETRREYNGNHVPTYLHMDMKVLCKFYHPVSHIQRHHLSSETKDDRLCNPVNEVTYSNYPVHPLYVRDIRIFSHGAECCEFSQDIARKKISEGWRC